jgi:hypothetical protein
MSTENKLLDLPSQRTVQLLVSFCGNEYLRQVRLPDSTMRCLWYPQTLLQREICYGWLGGKFKGMLPVLANLSAKLSAHLSWQRQMQAPDGMPADMS